MMKNLLKYIFVLGATVLFGCDKDDSQKSLSFNEKVDEITSSTQFKPSLGDFAGKEWVCTDWKLNFYSQVEMVGEWNAYKNTILEGEKNQLYKIDNNQLSVLKPNEVSGELQNKIQKTSPYTWNDSGELDIDDVKYTVKMQNEKLYLYFDTKDIAKVGKSFNVTVDNTYGNSLKREGGVIGIGLIQFTKKEITQTTQESTDNVLSLINKFINRDDILNQKFNIIETSSTDHTYILSGGDDNNKHSVSLTNHQIDLTTITPDRAKLLFNAFVRKTVFKFKGVDLKINKIEHEDGSDSGFLVYGLTSQTAETVKFYYNTSSVKEHWLIAPQGTHTTDTKLIVGIWSYDRIGGSRVTYGITTKYEYKADNSCTITDWAGNVKETGTWSINPDNTKLKIVLNKKINIATQETTDYNKTFEYDIILISNDEMNLRIDWIGNTKLTLYFSRV